MRRFLIILTLLISQAAMAQVSAARQFVLQDLSVISQENKCAGGKSRNLTKIELSEKSPSKYSRYFGITSNGDIAVIYTDKGKTLLELYVCPRDGLDGSGEITSEFVLDKSPSCEVDQISAGDVRLGTKIGYDYYLKFHPIYIPGTEVLSSLCGGEDDDYMYDNDRMSTSKTTTSSGQTKVNSVINR